MNEHQREQGPKEMKGQIGAPFKAPNRRQDETNDRPTRDESNYGAPFKPKRPEDAEQKEGIPCPKCKSRHNTEVIDTRAKGDQINRKRKCKRCQNVFLTHEELAFKMLKNK